MRVFNLRSFSRRRGDSVTILPPSGKIWQRQLAWLMWIVSAIFVLFQFCLQLTSGEIVSGLMKSFHLTALGGGFLASTYYYVYVSLQTPVGLLIDRFGPRKLLSIGAFILASGCLLFASSANVYVAIFGRLLMGGGAAFAFVGSLSVAAKWFPVERFGLLTACLEMIGMMGSLVGGFLLADLVQHVGWRNSIYFAAVFSAILVILLWTIVRDAPSNMPQVSVQPKKTKENFWQDVKLLLKSKIAWKNALFSGLMFSIVTVFIALWAVPFLQIEHHLSLMMSALVCNVVFVGTAIGSPIIGFIDSRVNWRRQILLGCAVVATVAMSILIYIPAISLAIVIILMFITGMTVSCYVINFVIASEISTPQTRSTSIGFTNTMSVGLAPILQPLIGFILFLLAGHGAAHGAMNYSLHDYQVALSIIPLLPISAAVLAWFIPTSKINHLRSN